MRKKIIALVGALALAGVALLTGAMPAQAATSEFGHVQTFAMPNAVDLDAKVLWVTSYNSVGTSSTEPATLSLKQKSTTGTNTGAGSIKATFKKANGNVVHTLSYDNLGQCPGDSDTSYIVCFFWPSGTVPNILLSDSPRVVIEMWTGQNFNGTKLGTFTYVYK